MTALVRPSSYWYRTADDLADSRPVINGQSFLWGRANGTGSSTSNNVQADFHRQRQRAALPCGLVRSILIRRRLGFHHALLGKVRFLSGLSSNFYASLSRKRNFKFLHLQAADLCMHILILNEGIKACVLDFDHRWQSISTQKEFEFVLLLATSYWCWTFVLRFNNEIKKYLP